MKNHNGTRNSSKTFFNFLTGPVKIKDGLFMGDEVAARDMDFIISNKVTHIINTVVKKVPNLWEKYGIQYLSVNWTDTQQNIFDKKNNTLNIIYNFIEEAMEEGQSCLIHSYNGKSRASTVIVGYLIKKYCWSLQKCLDLISSKKEKFAIRTNFLKQLEELEKRLMQIYNLSNSWEESKNEDDLVIRNTYKNTKIVSEFKKINKTNKKKIAWGQKIIVNSNRTNVQNVMTSMNKYKQYKDKDAGKKKLKSILKGFQSDEEQQKQKQKEQSILFEKTETLKDQNKQLAKSQIVGGLSGNVVNTSVNNYMGTSSQMKGSSVRYNRPQSSDVKEKEKKLQSKSGSKLMPYENVISSFKSPYDSIFMNKVGSNTKGKKKDEVRPPTTGHERTYSNTDKKKPKNYIQMLNKSRDEVLTGKRYTSNHPRQNIFKYK